MRLKERALTTACCSALAASALMAAGCGGVDTPKKPTPPAGLEIVDAGVAADPSIAGTLEAKVVTLPTSPAPGLRAISSAFQIDAKTQPERPVRVALPLAGQRDDEDFLVAMVADNAAGPWTPVAAKASADGRYAEFRAPHFSFFWIGRTSVRELISAVKDLFDGATGGAYAEAKQPKCADETGARTEGFSITSEGPDTLKWCFGRERDGRRLLRVTNARRYYLMLQHPGAKTVTVPQGNWSSLPAKITPGLTALPPGTQVTYSVSGPARVRSEFDGLAQSLYALDIGAELAVSFLTKFGGNKATTKEKLVNEIFGADRCLRQLGEDPGDGGGLIKECFGPDILGEAFGAKGVLAGTFMLVSGVGEFFRSELNALRDIVSGRDKYAIRVKRVQPPVLGVSDYVNGGEGWGTVAPSLIFNGGSPGGRASDITWENWGTATARGRGKLPLSRPEGNYYPSLGAIELEATRLSTCPGDDQPAYTRLRIRAPEVPGGPLGAWALWSLDLCEYAAEPAACADVAGTPQTDDVTTDVTAWDTDCRTAEKLAETVSDIDQNSAGGPDGYRAQADGFACSGFLFEDGLQHFSWTCVRGTAQVGFSDY